MMMSLPVEAPSGDETSYHVALATQICCISSDNNMTSNGHMGIFFKILSQRHSFRPFLDIRLLLECIVLEGDILL